MKLKQAIAQADSLRPNLIPDETKAAWVYGLEGEIAEMMRVEPPENVWPVSDDAAPLLMPYPHDGIYTLYLCAMIDNANEESALYANDMTVANAAITQAKAWWWRQNPSPSPKSIKL